MNVRDVWFTGTNQITLVAFKNIDILLIYVPNKARMPIFGHTFVGHNSAIFGLIWLKSETQETIIFRLVKINPSYHAYIQILNFWTGFGKKVGVVATQVPTG